MCVVSCCRIETPDFGFDSLGRRCKEDGRPLARYKRNPTEDLLRETSIAGVWHRRCIAFGPPTPFPPDDP